MVKQSTQETISDLFYDEGGLEKVIEAVSIAAQRECELLAQANGDEEAIDRWYKLSIALGFTLSMAREADKVQH